MPRSDTLADLLHDRVRAQGAVFADVDGVETVRHYGDPASEYATATEGVGLVLRLDRSVVRVHGRAPRQMLQGILTNSVTEPPTEGPEGSIAGAEHYAAILTPKGRLVSDLKQSWLAKDETGGIGLDVPVCGKDGVLEYFGRFLPPRFAVTEDLTDELLRLTVVGPGADACVTSVLGGLPEDGFVLLEGGPLAGGVSVSRGLEQVRSWDVLVGAARALEFWDAFVGEERAAPVGWGVWETLRVENGFPRFGVDMDTTTIPIEAGIGDRAFDHGKGCYTGQEVIVRIRHRGHVNWHLRALRFGEVSPRAGDELFEANGERVLGRVTSSVQSPAFGQVVGIGSVRREVEIPGTLVLGDGSGPEVTVERLPAEGPLVGDGA